MRWVDGAIERACDELAREMSGVIVVGSVDLETGMVSAQRSRDDVDPRMLDVVALAATDLHRGPSLARVASLLSRDVGMSHTTMDELHLVAPERLYFLKVLNRDALAIFATTDRTTNPGLGWVQLRQSCAQALAAEPIEHAC